ncbi:MAG TPA: hypothetical protein VK448_00085 [Dissulfurispiraceae bacterium]|nr:hypothetical protein [Dissulfurispiraceae bacterium]
MKKANRVYILLIVLGALLTLAELTLSLINSSLCSSEGCRIVESYLRFDERYMYALGFLFFCALFIAERNEDLKKLSSLLLICALAAEGYLVGFQFFVAHTVCPFCITVASIIMVAAFLKFIGGIREPVLAGFCLFALIFTLVGSINASSLPIPAGKQNVLIYSKDCPHCEEVIRFSKEKAIPLTLCEAGEVKGALRWMGIDSVPVLVCSDNDGKKIYTGANTIKAVLTAKYEPSSKEESARSKTILRQRHIINKKTAQNDNNKESAQNKSEAVDYLKMMVGPAASTNEGSCSITTRSSACE